MMHKDSKLTREFLLGSSSKTSTQTATNNNKKSKKDEEKRKPRVVHSMLDLNPRAANSTIDEDHQRQDNGIINGNASYSFVDREKTPLLGQVVVIQEETCKTTQPAIPRWGREDSCSSLCLSEAVAPPPKVLGALRTGRRHSMMAVPEHTAGDDVVALSDSQADLIFARYQPTRRRRGRNMTNRFQDLSVDRRELLLDNEESFRSILSDMRSSTNRGGDNPNAVPEKDDDDSTMSEVSETDVDDNDFDIEVMSSMMNHSQFEQARVACFEL